MAKRYSVVETVPVGTSAAVFMGAEERRVAVLISLPTTAGVSVTLSTEADVTTDAGLNLVGGGPPVLLTREMFGEVVTQRWYAIGSVGTTVGMLVTYQE